MLLDVDRAKPEEDAVDPIETAVAVGTAKENFNFFFAELEELTAAVGVPKEESAKSEEDAVDVIETAAAVGTAKENFIIFFAELEELTAAVEVPKENFIFFLAELGEEDIGVEVEKKLWRDFAGEVAGIGDAKEKNLLTLVSKALASLSPMEDCGQNFSKSCKVGPSSSPRSLLISVMMFLRGL